MAAMRVIIVDDGLLFRAGLVALLTEAGVQVTAELSEATALVETVHAQKPDVAILDIRMPPTYSTEGLAAALGLRTSIPSCGILLLSQYVESHHALDLLGASAGGGGVGYLLKDRVRRVTELVDSLERIRDGGTVIDPDLVSMLIHRRRTQDLVAALTDRERQTLHLLAEGYSNRAIATRLGIGARTLETYVSSTFLKLGLQPDDEAHRRVRAVLLFLRATSP